MVFKVFPPCIGESRVKVGYRPRPNHAGVSIFIFRFSPVHHYIRAFNNQHCSATCLAISSKVFKKCGNKFVSCFLGAKDKC